MRPITIRKPAQIDSQINETVCFTEWDTCRLFLRWIDEMSQPERRETLLYNIRCFNVYLYMLFIFSPEVKYVWKPGRLYVALMRCPRHFSKRLASSKILPVLQEEVRLTQHQPTFHERKLYLSKVQVWSLNAYKWCTKETVILTCAETTTCLDWKSKERPLISSTFVFFSGSVRSASNIWHIDHRLHCTQAEMLTASFSGSLNPTDVHVPIKNGRLDSFQSRFFGFSCLMHRMSHNYCEEKQSG